MHLPITNVKLKSNEDKHYRYSPIITRIKRMARWLPNITQWYIKVKIVTNGEVKFRKTRKAKTDKKYPKQKCYQQLLFIMQIVLLMTALQLDIFILLFYIFLALCFSLGFHYSDWSYCALFKGTIRSLKLSFFQY